MVSLKEVLRKFTFKKCGFDGSERYSLRTLHTFNLNSLIFSQLRDQCCQPSLNINPRSVNRALHVDFECIILLVFVWLLSFLVLFIVLFFPI